MWRSSWIMVFVQMGSIALIFFFRMKMIILHLLFCWINMFYFRGPSSINPVTNEVCFHVCMYLIKVSWHFVQFKFFCTKTSVIPVFLLHVFPANLHKMNFACCWMVIILPVLIQSHVTWSYFPFSIKQVVGFQQKLTGIIY